MQLKVYKCECCKKETIDFFEEHGWIHIDCSGLIITDGKRHIKTPIIRRFTELIKTPTDFNNVLDFCSLKCFVKWLFLSIQTDHENDYSKHEFFKKAVKTLVDDEYLREIIIDCLKSENL